MQDQLKTLSCIWIQLLQSNTYFIRLRGLLQKAFTLRQEWTRYVHRRFSANLKRFSCI